MFHVTRKLFVALSLFLLVLLAACQNDCAVEDFSKIEAERSPLAFGLESYMSFADAVSTLRVGEDGLATLEDSRSGGQDGIPPYNILTVKVSDVGFNEYQGDLMLMFLNDRLMEIRFVIDELDKSSSAIINVGQDQIGESQPYTEIWISTDHNYIGWGDKRLRRQARCWIERYA